METKSNVPNHVGWESPSNIALIKYWGKHGRQLPQNPSVSFTLSTASTRTFISYVEENKRGEIALHFTFEGKENPKFSARIEKFLASIATEYFPFLYEMTLTIDSSNSFPHSSGIASSASGMSALALCLCDIEAQISGKPKDDDAFIQKASLISRLGSGSACRSVFPIMGAWGFHPKINGSSDEYAIGVEQYVDPIFKTFHDDILIVSAKEKSVSSTAGHNLMVNNPYATARYAQANERMSLLLKALSSGDLSSFGKITEDEALTLHALMMCSDPSYILMEENSLVVIKKVISFREDTGVPLYFTLDAGPNVHLLYPDEFTAQVRSFILSDLVPYCHEGRVIHDQVGQGAQKLK